MNYKQINIINQLMISRNLTYSSHIIISSPSWKLYSNPINYIQIHNKQHDNIHFIITETKFYKKRKKKYLIIFYIFYLHSTIKYMHLQTTLILSNTHCSFKNNHITQFSNFSHPLKVLQKTDNQLIEILARNTVNTNNTNNSGFTGTGSATAMKSMKSTKQSFIGTNTQIQKPPQPQYFNQDEGILHHLHQKFRTITKSNQSRTGNTPRSNTRKYSCINPQYYSSPSNKSKPFNSTQDKCFILFGFSINLLQIEKFQTSHPQLNLNIKFYHYSNNQYFKQVNIKSLDEQPFQKQPQKYRPIVDALGGEDILDCEEISFVLSYWEEKGNNQMEKCQMLKSQMLKKSKTYIYFFPNINALRSEEERREERTQLTLNLPTTNLHLNKRQISSTSNQSESVRQTMTSLRKSHQNFRILQVLEYYLKLECHSQHIMITSNQSRIIKEFLDLIYQQSIKKFFVYIDHERKGQTAKSKSTMRSILNTKTNNNGLSRVRERDDSFDSNERNQEEQNDSPPSSKVYTSDICSQKQFISIDGQIIINDQFLSKLSEIKLPEPWLDSNEFREQKKLMYKMKLQEYNQARDLKKMKDQFTDTINYLKSLIGLEKVTYEEISIESLKVIKNAKIRQSTQQVKELENIWQQKQIRSQQLKQKLKQYEIDKHNKNGDHEQNLAQLRKDILAVQKQLNLHRNQLNAIYDARGEKENVDEKSKGGSPQNLRNSKQTDGSNKPMERSTIADKVLTKSIVKNNTRPQTSKPFSTTNKSKMFGQNVLTTTSQQGQQPPPPPKVNRHSAIKGNNRAPNRTDSLIRRSSQLLTKYAPILQQLRKQKYQQSLKQQMTKCQFEAQKQFEKYKEEYTKACQELRFVLNDCD